MTADASIRSIIEIAVDMALRAIVRDWYVRARDGPNGGMIKCRRHPCLIRVALNTIRRELRRNVIRIRGRVEIRLVTADASIWRIIEVPVDIAFSAVVCDWDVRACDWPNGCVVKWRRRPCLICVALNTIRWELRRHVIRIRSRVKIWLVTADASIRSIIEAAVDMAFRAIVRNGHVRACDGPNGGMIKRWRRPGLICVALNTIRGKLRCNVVRIRGRIEVRLMATDAGVWSIVEVPVDMALRAIVRDGHVRASDGPNGGVVKRRRHPRLIGMALNTIRGELRRYVIRIGSRVEIRLMAADASIRSIIEVSVGMAFRAIICDGNVCSCNRPNGSMVKRGRCPCLIRMTDYAIRTKITRNVIRIRSCVEVRLVTADASVRSIIEVPVDMALRAIVRDGYVRARDRPNGGMIKWRRRPCLIRVALNTIRWELRRYVIRICGRVEIRLVTTDASIRSIIEVAVDMAFRTIVRDGNVCACDWPNGVMVKNGRHPRLIRVANYAIRTKITRNVIRIRGRVEIRLMTADASIRCIIEIAVNMAFRAIVGDGHVCARDRPNGGMIKWRRRPRLIRVALNTIRRELRCYVVRIRGRVEIRLMTADASIWCIVEVAVDMAFRAIVRDRHVRASDWPNLVVVWHLCRTPSLRSMTLGAILIKTHPLMHWVSCSRHIRLMTTHATCRQSRIPIGMALGTGCVCMSTRQRKLCVIMIESVSWATILMAGKTSLIFIEVALHSSMCLIGLRIGMTIYALKNLVIRGVLVTFGTVIPSSLMRTRVDWKMLSIVRRKFCGLPTKVCGMALRTILWKLRCRVIWALRCLIIRLMARITITRQTLIIGTSVTSFAILYVVAFL
jgi:CO dehydrogenase/acetyl-CoA synthase epsilon subunit/predicted nucleic acid-binding Zn finger protein